MQDREKEQSQKESEYRVDGYKNLVNKYGTKKDTSEQYRFVPDGAVTDIELTINYEENGLFSKIIDLPADDAVSSGFSYGINDTDMETFINNSLEELDFEEKAATALKWARLYGGALLVVIVDDGKGLTDPVDWDNIRGVDEIIVFEKPIVQPDYSSIYSYKPNKKGPSKFGTPEFYDISPRYGIPFKVHESRCLLFKNGTVPSMSTKQEYQFFGIPEYIKIHKALQEAVTSHGNGVRLLDRSVQAIYKMKDLAELLSSVEGEDTVLRRLEIIDMARGILNSIVIDSQGEDYDFKSITFSGIKDIIDSTCNMLSAVTNIPQTKLFGRSPAGENATGESDMENYYKYVGQIQKLNLKGNLRTLIDMILAAGVAKGKFEDIPDYKLIFNPMWSLSDAEQAAVEQAKAAAELTKAQTAQIYVDMQALDASEVRTRLAEKGEFTINDVLEEGDMDWSQIPIAEDTTAPEESLKTKDTALSAEHDTSEKITMDAAIPTGCGVIVIKNGKFLVGERKDNGLICGPGGHIEDGETPAEAAARETREEFGIQVNELIPVTLLSDMPEEYCPSQVFLCTEYSGEPNALDGEMENIHFEEISDLMQRELFLPFSLSIQKLIQRLNKFLNHEHSERADARWITTRRGKHVQIGKHGELLKGHPANIGGGDKVGGKSKEQQKPTKNKENKLQEQKKSGNIVSALGANSLNVKGFKNKQHLNNHWQNGRTHKEEYLDEGITTKEQYEKRAVELAEMPVGGDILGYKTKEGHICRYDKEKNDYVKADIEKGIRTMFKPDEGEAYYHRQQRKEGIEDE